MATGRKSVAPGQVVASDWGNLVWDQSIQCFTSAADRDNQYPVSAAHPGALCYLEDAKQIQVFTNGAWKVAGADISTTGTVLAGVPYNPVIHRPHTYLFHASVSTNQYGQINVPVSNAGFLGYCAALSNMNNRMWFANIDFANTPSLTALLLIMKDYLGNNQANLSVDISVNVSGWK